MLFENTNNDEKSLVPFKESVQTKSSKTFSKYKSANPQH